MAKTSPRNSSQPEPVGGLDGRGRSTLSAFDRRLFQELQKDGRVPFVALADKLGVSEAHVRKRVARLTGIGSVLDHRHRRSTGAGDRLNGAASG